ncbi:MAG: SRPBCC family protein [Mariniblastus sp.]
MTRTIVARKIAAPSELVFKTVADIREFSKVIPEITNINILSEQQVGVGTRFQETRLMHGREATVELEVTEYVENKKIRIVSDTNGTVWDSIFTVNETTESGSPVTELQLVMEARTSKFSGKVINFLIKGMIKKAIQNDLDVVKSHCETRSSKIRTSETELVN